MRRLRELLCIPRFPRSPLHTPGCWSDRTPAGDTVTTVEDDSRDDVQRRTVFTTSWDDGHPNDLRVAEILARYGIKGTFYVPIQNRDGRPVIESRILRRIAELHEIGSHTFSHCCLNNVSLPEARREIVSGKAALEDRLGRAVSGFCYPGGKFRDAHVGLVQEAGFQFGRVIENCRTDVRFGKFRMPTTLQLYPHKRAVYVRNFLRQGHWGRRTRVFSRLLRSKGLLARLMGCLELAQAQSGCRIVHFWGHSWELEATGGWEALDECCRYVANSRRFVALDNENVAKMGLC
jgi:peptidoglycan/xylan/chitin deacetylase (PgdA/CDA1 family)